MSDAPPESTAVWRKDYDAFYDDLDTRNANLYDPGWCKRFIQERTSLPRTRGTLADVGSGNGIWSAVLSQWHDVTGLDNSEAGIRIARERHGTRSNLRFELCDIKKATGLYDTVFARGPEFFGSYAPEHPVFQEFLPYVMRLCRRRLVFITYTERPFRLYHSQDRLDPQWFEGSTSFYHDPVEIDELFSAYGTTTTTCRDNYLVCEVERFGTRPRVFVPSPDLARLEIEGDGDGFVASLAPTLARFCGVDVHVVPPSSDRSRSIRLADASVSFTRQDGAKPVAPEAWGERGPSYDPMSALRYWLTDQGNERLGQDAWDAHGRLRHRASAQARFGVIAPVNDHLGRLREWVQSALPAPVPEPFGPYRAVILLSHDVDDPLNPGSVRHRSWIASRAGARGRGRTAWKYARRTLRALRRRWRRQRHWLFEEIIDAEAKHGFQSTFFFASRPWFREGVNPLDVDYDVRGPHFARVFDQIRDAGSEVGLHISYGASSVPGAIAEERQWLEEAAGGPVFGSRHHYWHMARPFWPTLRAHQEAGLRYDSSVAFNDEPGLRLGVAFPFQPWLPDTGEGLDIVQLPVCAMDGAYFYKEGQTVDAATAELASLVDDLKACRGLASIDWHVRTSWPGSEQFSEWGRTYLELLDLLAADPEVLVMTCKQAAAAFRHGGPA